MDSVSSAIVTALMTVLASLGVTFILGDYRHFDTFEQQCKDRGYIQNTKTRINCSVEVSK